MAEALSAAQRKANEEKGMKAEPSYSTQTKYSIKMLICEHGSMILRKLCLIIHAQCCL